MNNIGIYVTSFKNPEREQAIVERFNKQGMAIYVYQGMDNDYGEEYQSVKRVWDIMESHLNLIKKFLESDYEYGVFCEDDILISDTFQQDLHKVIEVYNIKQMDLILLGYLINVKPIDMDCQLISLYNSTDPISLLEFYNYPDHLWGSQCYLIDRKFAKQLVERYTIDFAKRNRDLNYSPDWLITKNCKKLLVWPPLAKEKGDVLTDHQGQISYHQSCSNFLQQFGKYN